MKKYILLALLITLIQGNTFAKKRRVVASNDTCIAIFSDTVPSDTVRQKTFRFPMIMVGNVSSFPDSVNIFMKALNLSDSLHNDSTPTYDGRRQLMEFFVRNIVYPNALLHKSAENNLRLQMQLDNDGNLKEGKVLDAHVPEMEKEVLRVMNLLPNLCTTDKRGKKTEATIEVPISFRILKL